MITSSCLRFLASNRQRLLAVCASLAALLIASRVSAQTTTTWQNTGNTSYTTAGNWDNGVPTSSTVASFNGATPTNPNITAAESVAGLSFGSSAGFYTLAGTGGSLSIGSSGIVDSTSGLEIINTGITLNAAQSWSGGASNNLRINGAVNLNGNNLTLNGTSGVINGTISGVGNLTFASSSSWILSSSTSGLTGNISVTSGSLVLSGASGTQTNITIAAAANAAAVVQVTGANQTIGTLLFNGASGSTGNVAIGSGATLTLGGTVTYNVASGPSDSTISGAGKLALGATTRNFAVGFTSGASTDLNISTAITGAGQGIVKTGAGTLTLSGASTYDGGSTVIGGVLAVVGTGAGTGFIDVKTGADLRGTGTVGGLVTLESGSFYRGGVGSGVGTLTLTNGLTLDSGAKFNFDLGTGGNDKLDLTGGVLTGTGAAGTLTLNIYAQGTFQAGTYDLIDFTGATTAPGSFDVNEFVLGAKVAGFDYAITQVGNVIELTATASAVPEPSTYAAILGACALGLVLLRQRKATRSISAA